MLRKQPRKVGMVGLGNMSAALYSNIIKGLPGVEIVDATDLVDQVRMVKSEEELLLHREAAYMHEMSYEQAKEIIQVGMTVDEIMQELRFTQMEYGSEEQQLAITVGPPNGPHATQFSWGNTYIRRPVQAGEAEFVQDRPRADNPHRLPSQSPAPAFPDLNMHPAGILRVVHVTLFRGDRSPFPLPAALPDGKRAQVTLGAFQR